MARGCVLEVGRFVSSTGKTALLLRALGNLLSLCKSWVCVFARVSATPVPSHWHSGVDLDIRLSLEFDSRKAEGPLQCLHLSPSLIFSAKSPPPLLSCPSLWIRVRWWLSMLLCSALLSSPVFSSLFSELGTVIKVDATLMDRSSALTPGRAQVSASFGDCNAKIS